MDSLIWISFIGFILSMLALDLFAFNRKAHIVSIKEALRWSVFWIALAAVFNVIIYYWKGPESALEFTAAYLIEKSLSMDNLFVFLMLFRYFDVAPQYRHKILFWGILGAIIFRIIFIIAGIELLERFEFSIYIMGAILIWAGLKMMLQKEKPVQPDKNPFLKLLKRFFPLDSSYKGSRFLIRKKGILYATPLFVVLIVIESTDIIFAVDSIPAVLAVSKDPFIAFSSNIFALLGLRSLFFVLSGMMDKFHLLKTGLSLILIFVGIKIILSYWYHLEIIWTLSLVGVVLIGSVLLSLIFPDEKKNMLTS
jgi:tellurite resistance protein TerC